ncbi:hypothetical protein HDU98_010109 [Podochytrium sp. JEL0797]|nr:hypothetical protein HDU98_010109 [Podochytrium sp. JEL0797]
MSLQSVIVPAATKHTATIFFLHGLGDSGHGWAPVGEQLSGLFPHVKFVFPNAPSIPITLNGGYKMPGWYDIISLDHKVRKEDEKGMLETVERINKLITDEIASGIKSKRIVLGGFSQGAAMTLLTSLKSDIKLAGFVGLSGYLPLADKLAESHSDTNQWTPYFMGHGDSDEVVAYEWGRLSAEKMKDVLGRQVVFKTYRGMGHSTTNAELSDLAKFLGEGDRPNSWENGDDAYDFYESDDDDDEFEVMSPIAFAFVAGTLADPANCFHTSGFRKMDNIALAFMTTFKLNEERKRKDFDLLKLVVMSNALRTVYQHIQPSMDELSVPEIDVNSEELVESIPGVTENIFRVSLPKSETDSEVDAEPVAVECSACNCDSEPALLPPLAATPKIKMRLRSKSLHSLRTLPISNSSTKVEERGYSSDSDASPMIKHPGKKLAKIPQHSQPLHQALADIPTMPEIIVSPSSEAPLVIPVRTSSTTAGNLTPSSIRSYLSLTSSEKSPTPTLERTNSLHSLSALQDATLNKISAMPLSPPPLEPESMLGSVKRKLSYMIPSMSSIRSATTKKPVEAPNNLANAKSPTSPAPAPATSLFSFPVNALKLRRSSAEASKPPVPPKPTSNFVGYSRTSTPPLPPRPPRSEPTSTTHVVTTVELPIFTFEPTTPTVETEIPTMHEMKRKSTEHNKKRKSSRLSTISSSVVVSEDASAVPSMPKSGGAGLRSRKSGNTKSSVVVEVNGVQILQRSDSLNFKHEVEEGREEVVVKQDAVPRIPTRKASRPDVQLSTNGLRTSGTGRILSPDSLVLPPRRESILRAKGAAAGKYAPIIVVPVAAVIPRRSTSRFMRNDVGEFEFDDRREE